MLRERKEEKKKKKNLRSEFFEILPIFSRPYRNLLKDDMP